MKQVVLISGAATGFGAITARALAHAGHTVYAACAKPRAATVLRSRPWNVSGVVTFLFLCHLISGSTLN
jgi:NAD(P)-dependent dehydrogenase (short-subunit alcohol dehydrogenase family)